MQRVMIVGAGKGGTAILDIFKQTADVVAVVDINPNAPGIITAQNEGIQTGTDWHEYMSDQLDIIIEVTGEDEVFKELRDARGKNTVLIPGSVAFLLATLLEEKEELIKTLRKITYEHNLIFNSSGDGMVVINTEGIVTLFNKSAEKITGTTSEHAEGKHVSEIIPASKLPRVLNTRKIEANQELLLPNGSKIITTRIPIIDENDQLIGAFSVFKDITEVVNLAEEITNLKEIQTMLQAIINSSDEAISVVDEDGRGIMINPAYTRITGLQEEEVIGQPATADISEGESMHMKVLKTRRPVRGTAMRVGPIKKRLLSMLHPS